MRKSKIIFILALFVLAALTFSFAQEEPANKQETAPSIEAPANLKNITAIEIKGNKSISSNTIISKMKAKVGSPYQEQVVSDDLKRLYLLGFFSDVKIDTEDYKDGLKLVINVIERPLIESIAFNGLYGLRMKDDKLKQAIKSKVGQYLDYPTLSEDVESLKKNV